MLSNVKAEKHSNINLNIGADGSTQQVYINLNGSDFVHGHLMTKEHVHFMRDNLECSLLVFAVCIKCVLLGTIFGVC